MAVPIGSEAGRRVVQDVAPLLSARGHRRQHTLDEPAPVFAVGTPADPTRVDLAPQPGHRREEPISVHLLSATRCRHRNKCRRNRVVLRPQHRPGDLGGPVAADCEDGHRCREPSLAPLLPPRSLVHMDHLGLMDCGGQFGDHPDGNRSTSRTGRRPVIAPRAAFGLLQRGLQLDLQIPDIGSIPSGIGPKDDPSTSMMLSV